jgi:hypothetical protein
VLGGAGLIRGKVGHADDVDAASRRRQCREMDTRTRGGGRAKGGNRPGIYFRERRRRAGSPSSITACLWNTAIVWASSASSLS